MLSFTFPFSYRDCDTSVHLFEACKEPWKNSQVASNHIACTISTRLCFESPGAICLSAFLWSFALPNPAFHSGRGATSSKHLRTSHVTYSQLVPTRSHLIKAAPLLHFTALRQVLANRRASRPSGGPDSQPKCQCLCPTTELGFNVPQSHCFKLLVGHFSTYPDIVFEVQPVAVGVGHILFGESGK